jgi:rod shape-determining protein MreB
MSVQGRDLLTGKPKQVEVSYREIAKALDKSIQRMRMQWKLCLKLLELAADIYNGIYLAGGGSMLRGLDKRFSKNRFTCLHAEDPLRAVVRGTGMALKTFRNLKYLNKIRC